LSLSATNEGHGAVLFSPGSSASSQSAPPSPHKDRRGCPTPSKNILIPMFASRSQTSAAIHMRDLVFPIAHFRLFHVRDVVRVSKHRFEFPGKRTPLHTPPACSRIRQRAQPCAVHFLDDFHQEETDLHSSGCRSPCSPPSFSPRHIPPHASSSPPFAPRPASNPSLAVDSSARSANQSSPPHQSTAC